MYHMSSVLHLYSFIATISQEHCLLKPIWSINIIPLIPTGQIPKQFSGNFFLKTVVMLFKNILLIFYYSYYTDRLRSTVDGLTAAAGVRYVWYTVWLWSCMCPIIWKMSSHHWTMWTAVHYRHNVPIGMLDHYIHMQVGRTSYSYSCR